MKNPPIGVQSSKSSRSHVWFRSGGAGVRLILLFSVVVSCCFGAEASLGAADEKVLDRVVAVVNNQVILESDIGLEMRIIHLLPIGDAGDYTAPKALERLITRSLIEQQIVLEDPHGMEVDRNEVASGLAELRQNLPACKRRDCGSVEGWKAYLETLELTPARVESYWSNRIAILRFIEQRFRSGIRITPEQIEKYYRDDLVPRYARRGDAPPLETLSPRIQEILLQERVNALMNDWLKSLQSQGQVEVLDASLRLPDETGQSSEHSSPPEGPAILSTSMPAAAAPSSASSGSVPDEPNTSHDSSPGSSTPSDSTTSSGSTAPPGIGENE